MKNQSKYHDLVKSFAHQHVANFQAMDKDEAHKQAIGEMRRGHEYRQKQEAEKNRTTKNSIKAIDAGLK